MISGAGCGWFAEALAGQKADAAELGRLRRENKRLAEGEGEGEEDKEMIQWIISPMSECRSEGGESLMTRHAFITAHAAVYPVRVLCHALGVARSWYL